MHHQRIIVIIPTMAYFIPDIYFSSK